MGFDWRRKFLPGHKVGSRNPAFRSASLLTKHPADQSLPTNFGDKEVKLWKCTALCFIQRRKHLTCKNNWIWQGLVTRVLLWHLWPSTQSPQSTLRSSVPSVWSLGRKALQLAQGCCISQVSPGGPKDCLWCCHWQNVICLPQGYTVYSFLLFPCKSVPDGKRSCTPQRRGQTPSRYGTTGDGSAASFRMGRQQGVLKSFCEQSKNLSIAMKCSLLRISNHQKSQLGFLEFLATFVWKGCEPLQSWPEFQAGNETNFPWFHYRNVSHL